MQIESVGASHKDRAIEREPRQAKFELPEDVEEGSFKLPMVIEPQAAVEPPASRYIHRPHAPLLAQLVAEREGIVEAPRSFRAPPKPTTGNGAYGRPRRLPADADAPLSWSV